MSQLQLFGSDLSQNEGQIRIPSITEGIFYARAKVIRAADSRPRINIENRSLLAAAGFVPGSFALPITGPDYIYLAHQSRPSANAIKIAPKAYLNRDGTKTFGGRLDLRRNGIADLFQIDEPVLATYCPSGVLITALPVAKRAQERWRHLVEAAHRRTIVTASAYSGICALDYAAHEGLRLAGFAVTSEFANDITVDALEAARLDNPAGARRSFGLPIAELLCLDAPLRHPNILIAGLPCTGATRLNVQTRSNPEMRHQTAGHQGLHFMQLLSRLEYRPSIILIENVVEWASSVACTQLRRALEDLGYATLLIGDIRSGCHDLLGSDFGNMERRRRIALLACPPELLPHLDFSLMRKSHATTTVADIRDPEHTIRASAYTKDPACFARKAQKRFVNRVLNGNERSVPVISAHPNKGRVEDPKFNHPTEPGSWRLPTPSEHARIKGIPPTMINSLPSDAAAHRVLGNSVTTGVWTELFRVIGAAISELSRQSRIAQN